MTGPGTGGEPSLEIPKMYDGAVVAEKVLWPLVDKVWGPWRSSVRPHEPLRFPMPGEHQGRTLDVVLAAEHSVQSVWKEMEIVGVDEKYESEDSFFEVSLSVSEMVSKESKPAVFSLVRAAFVETFAPDGFDEDEPETDEPEEPELDEDGFPMGEGSDAFSEIELFKEQLGWLDEHQKRLNIKQGTMYIADSSGRVCTKLTRKAWVGNKVINVPGLSGEVHAESFNIGEFSSWDLDEIEAGCFILDAPNAVHKAIAELRDPESVLE